MGDRPVMVITGTHKGIGRFLAEHYANHGYTVYGCSRTEIAEAIPNYSHFCLDVSCEPDMRKMISAIRSRSKRIDVLINNAGIASMNAFLLTPTDTVQKIFNTNVLGTFLFCREAAKLMQRKKYGRIVNFTTVADPLNLEGEAIYAASKAAVVKLTKILARELGAFNITVNAVGPSPVKTDLIKSVPDEKLQKLLDRQAIRQFAGFADIVNVVDFFIRPGSAFVTGQVLYLGGV